RVFRVPRLGGDTRPLPLRLNREQLTGLDIDDGREFSFFQAILAGNAPAGKTQKDVGRVRLRLDFTSQKLREALARHFKRYADLRIVVARREIILAVLDNVPLVDVE